MEAAAAAAATVLPALVPSGSAVVVLFAYLGYLAAAGAILPGKLVAGAVLPDSSRLHYRCNGLLSLLLLLGLSAIGAYMGWMSPTVVADRGLELLSVTFIFSVLVSFALYFAGIKSGHKNSSLRPHVSGSFIQDWWLGVQLNPHFMGVDLKWDIIAERLGFMLVFGDLVFIPFTFTLQGWWLLRNEVELSLLAGLANFCIFVIGYLVFRGANKQKHVFKKDPKAPIWGKPPKVVGGKLLASGYCSVIPYFYPTYLLILLIWRERRDEARCSQKYKEIWADYCRLVPWRILPYVY
ncbi:Delta(14)-sterol reductase [Dichanthelium oligosanthes]|uniref:Delta(14)-sterol reductase n=1 Tax=Dichanthelium oligosanthes TaxID=888268 RepID=A0A1E5W3I8_9POAL|nr:Delta(14)-sterol reductase [Dichanthelium oligosanthes]